MWARENSADEDRPSSSTIRATHGREPAVKARKKRSDSAVLDRAAILSRHPLFRDLGREVHEAIAAYATTRTVRRGTTIFAKGDAGTCLFAVCRGTVEVAVLSTEGKNAIVNLIREGEVFGEIALLDGQTRTADAIAFTDCALMVIERRDFLPLLREQPDIALKLLEVLCARVRRTTEQVEELMFRNVESRLARMLCRLTESEDPPHRISITQRALGETVGVSREETNKQLQIWSGNGVVRLERGQIVVLQPTVLAQAAVA
jgi:CRP/FNR family transcriptional regulator, cyclic AMP receptor protein